MRLTRTQWSNVAEKGDLINMGFYLIGETWWISHAAEGKHCRENPCTSDKAIALSMCIKWIQANGKCYNESAQTAIVRSPRKGRCE